MRHPLVPSIPLTAAALALGACAALAWPSAAQAATRMVSNCNDSGAGSLRAAINGATSGDTIDLRSLTCPRIVLSGQIDIPQQDLNLLGPGRFALTIDGNRVDRVFAHSGTGRLLIDRMSIAYGNEEAGELASGGCIDSQGAVELRRSRVHHCRVWVEDAIEGLTWGGGIAAIDVVLNRSSVFANIAGRKGNGGGIFARRVTLYRSQVYGNVVQASGGGIYGATVTATYSLIHGNDATLGGGMVAMELRLNKTTVSANRGLPRPFLGSGENEGGGIWMNPFFTDSRSTIVDSTISGNSAYLYSAGRLAGEVLIYNSTITNNLENAPDPIDTGVCQGVGALYAPVLRLESTIVAGNPCNLPGPRNDIAAGSTVSGRRNLIGTSAVAVPADSIRTNDPRLAPLGEYGGPTRTHLPLADSPAIDRGSNPLNREFDQRGPGFPRVKGPAPDIGATER